MKSRITSNSYSILMTGMQQTRKYSTESVSEFMHTRSYTAFEASLFGNSMTQIKHEYLASGSTMLHRALHDGVSVQDIETMIAEHGKEAIARLARTVNNDNLLPIDLVNPQDIELTSLISALTILPEAKQQPDLNEIVKRYAVSRDSQLYTNLELGVAVANTVNQLGLQTSTTPELNHSKETRKNASRQVTMYRNIFGKFAHLRTRVPDGWDRTKTLFTNIEASFIKHAQSGNCYEYSITALSVLRAMDSGHVSEMYGLRNPHYMGQPQNSGHDFLVIDRASDSKPGDFTTFGKHAVLIDAWGKTVIPAANPEALEAELTSNEQHTCYLTKGNPRLRRTTRVLFGSTYQFNVNPVYNPHVHEAAPFFRIEEKNSTERQSFRKA